MQFRIVVLAAAAAGLTSARGLPHSKEMLAADGGLFRRSTCDATPTATSDNTNTAPIASPDADTAADCQDECDGNAQCQSFAFGTTADGSGTECLLFSVAAEEVPAQDNGNLRAFDKACDDVSTAAPRGVPAQKPKRVRRAHMKAEAKRNNKLKKRIRKAAQEAKQAAKKGAVIARDTCGKAHASTTNQDASPVQTLSVTSAAECLNKCKQTTGCKSVEFGKPSVDGQKECLLFEVAAAQLPAPSQGQSLVAYDVGCST